MMRELGRPLIRKEHEEWQLARAAGPRSPAASSSPRRCSPARRSREPLIFKATPQTAAGKYYTMTVNGAKECDVGKKYLEPKKGYGLSRASR